MNIEQQYIRALEDIKAHGKKKLLFNAELGKEDPNTYILSLVGRTFHHDMSEGFPAYTSKFVYWKGAIAEMLWFISGSGDLKKLQEMNVKIWDDWGGRKRSDILKLHYTNMTDWRQTGLDQTEWILEELPKKPYRKSYIVSYLDPQTTYHMAEKCGEDSVEIVACHYSHHVLCQEPDKLTLTFSIRSQDMFLGNPFNVAQYAALLEMYCVCFTNRTGKPWTPDQLVLNLTGDYHLYSNQLEQVDQQIQAEQYPFPTLEIVNRGQIRLQDFTIDDFSLKGYKHSGKIPADVYVAGGY
jgi:thymidylate synthase